jgi:hypothetical protein
MKLFKANMKINLSSKRFLVFTENLLHIILRGDNFGYNYKKWYYNNSIGNL